MKFSRIETLFFLILLFGISGCNYSSTETAEPEIADGGIISGYPCSPPCFMGITPGISSRIDTKAALERNGFLNYCEDRKYEKVGATECGKYTISIIYSENADIVKTITYKPSTMITVSEIIELYGTPEFVEVSNEDTSPEHHFLAILLFYPAYQMNSITVNQEGEEFEISPTTPLVRVVINEFALEKSQESQNWVGYGKYSIHK